MFINNLAYEASAGSGKTFMLVVRYLSLLFKGAEPSKVLALTFTNKAASEMSERIIETLEDLDSRTELSEIAKECGMDEDDILAQRSKILAEFLNAHTKIMTIDSFFTQILRKFSLYASLMPDFTTANAQHEVKLMSRFLKEVSVANKRSTLINLSLESSKRVSDIFALLDDFYLKKEELSHLKFNKTSTKELEQEAMEVLGTLQSIIANCKGASPTLQKAVVAQNFDELKAKTWVYKESLNYWVFKKCFIPEMDMTLQKIQDAVKAQIKVKEQNFFSALNELVDIYKKAKKALYIDESELSFSDVTLLVYEILNRLDESEFLYFRLDATIEHMLLDEFQDTSVLQYEILKPLIQEITSGEGICSEGSFFFVGDVKQSIYRFRGGVSALFGEVVKENRTEVKKLVTNYRSQKEVIEFVNSVFINKMKDYTPQLVRKEAQGGYVEVIVNDELLEELATQVKRLITLGADVNDIAILCATNSDGQAIKNALEEENIEVVTETTTKLINQRSVKAVLEYLKYLYFREDIYKHNFFALIDKDVSPIRYVDFSGVTLVDVVKKCIDEYKLFHDDFHLIRFLSAVANYADIEALLFEYERLDTSAAAADISGVRVLTVHKSKGLEYEHVIVMDRLKKAPAARDAIIYNYDGIKLQNLYLRTKNRELIDNDYAYALAKEKELMRDDSLNALYVAFTRARENLIIIEKSKDSTFDLLDLQTGSFGELRSTCKAKSVPQEHKKLSFENIYYGTQSDLLALESQEQEDLQAINFGIALHYTLEMMHEFTQEALQCAKNMMLNKYGFMLEESEIDDIVQRISRLVDSEEFLNLTQGTCYREKALRYKNNLRYLDLLVKKDDGKWCVIDYKSSLKYTQHHIKQVRYYIKAVQEITDEAVEGYICYILEDAIKTVKVL
ncbi:RecB-like helicase [Sulfurimonas autotrophica]|uniref:DNA 3'-5' helicase n=1 Tax=Sulfurimonas autotrophica (strain ATCC BAA-671 / DSM 16294 / JCM 11897 / OK10) TaxID=563040 RepID=E0UR43_SULAO|nr:RecB-like helicase [Sulfurimonas autotrophica]ADN09999.1 UvrD/REP helicase [Sulfurimonas autotrophica DSM 16294]